MPEGDTIFRAARSLDRILTGRRLVRFELQPGGRGTAATSVAGPQPRELVTSVRAQGKHLLIAFEGGLTLHTHLQMHGGWHAYRPGEPWKKSPGSARVVIEVADAAEPDVPVAVAVCFAAPVVELLEDVAAHPRLAALGPDLCRPDADLADAVARLDRLPPDSEIGTALLDQRVACGVGNVYKSETLFACKVNPFTPVSAIPDGVRRRLLETASRLLRSNLDAPGGRSTLGVADGTGAVGPARRGGLAVYGRAGRPCRRCGTIIRSRRQGSGRMTYWCPACQAGGRAGDPPLSPTPRTR
jgi:endonuclease-8